MAYRHSSGGFTYLTVLFIVAILSSGLALAGRMWHTDALREKETELLYVGNQYRKAIERYYLTGQHQYPRTFADLLKDPRRPTTERYLRRLYPDPMTANGEWGLIKAPDGGIMGVYSLSEEKPFKSANFQARDKAFEGMEKYSDWKFIAGTALQGSPQPAAKPAAPAPAVTRK